MNSDPASTPTISLGTTGTTVKIETIGTTETTGTIGTTETTETIGTIVSSKDIVYSKELVKDVRPDNRVHPDNRCGRCTLGCCQCMSGCIGCPLISAGSFFIGVGMTVKACLTLNCLSEDFIDERELWCKCWGVGTGCAISTLLVLEGYSNMTFKPRPKQVIIYESTMTR
jgi:hypothetical protein